MLTMRIKGGLGNQLFQYAAVYALSKRLNQPFQFDYSFTNNMTLRGYKLKDLKVIESRLVESSKLPIKINIIKNKYINKACRILDFSQIDCDDYLYWLETKDEWQEYFFGIQAENIYIDGYFQSEDYFKEYRGEIISQFVPNYRPENTYLDLLNGIRSSNSIAVHVRRGDFKKDGHPFHYVLDQSYYKKAISIMETEVSEPIFYWFSNDMDWVMNNVGVSERYRFVNIKSKHSDIDELMLMKNCKHIIAANSTFSWWAAWLNENNPIILVPSKNYGMDRMIPEDWIRVPE
ncbi:MAG: alpha-1,2-fucosyltransferase [Phascolarctobacterium sp.]|nr:alpha-1,2-fucosyltransferase [Phascolarctobacterium sp.]